MHVINTLASVVTRTDVKEKYGHVFATSIRILQVLMVKMSLDCGKKEVSLSQDSINGKGTTVQALSGTAVYNVTIWIYNELARNIW